MANIFNLIGIESLLFTSDTPTLTGDWGNIDYELMTANFKWGSVEELARIKVQDGLEEKQARIIGIIRGLGREDGYD